MRILRIKRGYTTNSSSGNEWIPPPKDHPQAREMYQRAVEMGLIPPEAVPEFPQDAAPARLGNGVSSPPGRTGNETAASNLGLIGLLVGAVCLLFVVGGLIKRFFRGRRRS